jgi:hypothetical protein
MHMVSTQARVHSESEMPWDGGPMLDYEKFEATPLKRDPFDYITVPCFIRPAALVAINRDYPKIGGPGTFPVGQLDSGPAFRAFWEELQRPRFRELFERKFGLDLFPNPMMATVREYCQPTDGVVHADSKTKIITILFYFNETWSHEGGRLRLLQSQDMNDYTDEVVPEQGNMIAFRVYKHALHGHPPFSGHRRIVQVHWVDPKRIEKNEHKRKTLKWKIKKALRLG